MKLYVVLPFQSYSCETWTCYSRPIKLFDKFHHQCAQKILWIIWTDGTTSFQILDRVNKIGLETFVIKAEIVKWSKHVILFPGD